MTLFLLGMATGFALAVAAWLVGAALTGFGKAHDNTRSLFETPGWFARGKDKNEN